MTRANFQFDYKDLEIDLKQIENILGYSEGDDREIVNSVIEEILNEPELFRNIRAEYIIYNNMDP